MNSNKAGCGKLETERCTLCAGAFYCGRKCQRSAWPDHKGPCKIATADLANIGSTVEIFDAKIKGYKRDAEKGNSDAQYQLALCYENGTGIAVDTPEAVKWYKRGAEGGSAPAQSNLAICYATSTSIAIDNIEAVKWYTRAAERRNVNAQFYLAICYEKGTGITVDNHEAIKCYARAAEAGCADAQ